MTACEQGLLRGDSRSLLARILVWGALFGVLWLLRSFFLLIFLTFVFSFLQAKGTDRLAPYVSSRPARVVISGLVLLSIIVAIGFFVIPRVREQAISFTERLPEYITVLDRHLLSLEREYPLVAELLPRADSDSLADGPRDLRSSPSAHLLQAMFGAELKGDGQPNVKFIVEVARDLGARLLAVGSAFLLSLLFSFLIVLDLPALRAGVRSLTRTRVNFIYEEVAHGLYSFARMMGRAFEAQFYIALINSVLTAIGILIIGIGDKVAFLSVLVFLCSFIPVAGVFISSIPICLLALQSSGFGMVIFAIILITVIHMIEAYILNPRIYGHHLRMNPVLVLIILTVSGKLFGVWGLILGVPVCTYIFLYAIRDESDRQSF